MIINISLCHLFSAKLYIISMQRIIVFFISCCFALSVHAGDTTALTLNGKQFVQCDSIEFVWNGHAIHQPYPLASLHLWIDNLETGQRWKLRYPILNGEAAGALEIAEDLKPGTYAFNFMAADHYLEIYGKLRKVKLKMALNHETGKMDTIAVYDQPGSLAQEMEYTLVGRAGVLYDSVLRVQNDGRFRIPPLVFGDTARLVFDPEKERSNYIIDMTTPLDTAFTPFWAQTVFVKIGIDSSFTAKDTSDYQFGMAGNYPNSITLEEVKVTGPSKIKQFEKDFVSPQFRNFQARTLNGLDSDEIMRFNSIWDYLRANTPGMILQQNGFQRTAFWRGQPVAFFLDEVLVDATTITMPPQDIAMIKVYPPPSMISAQAPGGAVAIYTKRGGDKQKTSPYNYIVMGYTQGEARWTGNR